MGMSAVNAGRSTWAKKTDERNRAAADELLTALLNASFDVLHHDTAHGTKAGDQMRSALRRKFARILKIKAFTS